MSFTPPPPAITFVYADWIAVYPMFSGISEPVAQNYFDIATMYCANRLGPVRTLDQLRMLLYLLTCHVAWIMSPKDAAGNPTSGAGANNQGMVGRISSATEGSVSVQTENLYPEGTAQWYQQTEWGSTYWSATAIYRTMRYRPGVRRYGIPYQGWLYPNGS